LDETREIKEYFEKTAEGFDAIYSKKKNFLCRFLDFVFRRSIQKRFEVTLKECGDLRGKSILDIGCGSGRYSVELAKRGAGLVVGIDFAENMLRLAGNLAEHEGVGHICRFIKGDFMSYSFESKFDICIAIGVLEYFNNPQVIFDRIKTFAGEKVIISLPVRWTFRSLLRKIRLTLKKRPVYFYTKKKIKSLLKLSEFKNYKIVRLDRDYLIMIRL
jgi:ubiquinone/menaquinone biosynthesis C-methylase UbiE